MSYQLFSDRAAFEATAGTIGVIFSKFYKPLYYFAFQQLHNRDRAEDAVATAILECWKNISHDPELALTVAEIEAELYEHAAYYCNRHLNMFTRDRVLAAIFNKEADGEDFDRLLIETNTVQLLAMKEA